MTDYICTQCNLCCEHSREKIIEMGLDPDSDNDYDRMIYCPNWCDMAIFERSDDASEGDVE